MSNYVKSTNFYAKDALSSGNPDKIIKGAEIDDEYNNLATAIATKADLNSPTFTGIPLAPTASAGTSTQQLATTAFVQNVAGSLGTLSSQNANAVAITGGTVAATFTGNLTGNLTGNVTGNVTGSSGSCTGNSATATLSTNSTNAIGYNQTWQNVTGSRSWNTSYTNSTGKPIMVSATNYASDGGLSAVVSGLNIAQTGQSGGTGNDIHNLIFIVPVGATYQLDPIRFAGSMLWTELS